MSSANANIIIPFDIQVDIIKRVLAVKSLLRFRSVSKQWNCFIDSLEFISHHYNLVKQTHPPHLFVSYKLIRPDDYDCIPRNIYVWIHDDDIFPRNKFYPTRPSISFDSCVIIGYSHGLVCLSSEDTFPQTREELIVVWKPSVRKSVGIVLPEGRYVIGFGVCPKTLDAKVVKITSTTPASMDRKAEVLNLSTRAWKSVAVNNLSMPLNLDGGLHQQQVVVDGAIHWADSDLIIKEDGATCFHHRIVSFDLTSEEFGEVLLPDIFSHGQLSILKLKESLALISHNGMYHRDIWMVIKNGDPNCSFSKLYSVSLDSSDTSTLNIIRIIGCWKNGQLIRKRIRMDGCGSRVTLEVYDPYTEHSKELGFGEISNGGFTMTSYTESLLLLNHSNFLIK